jgi:hypothetical protein
MTIISEKSIAFNKASTFINRAERTPGAVAVSQQNGGASHED